MNVPVTLAVLVFVPTTSTPTLVHVSLATLAQTVIPVWTRTYLFCVSDCSRYHPFPNDKF